MELTGTFVYQGRESRTGIKDPSKIYYEAAFISGVEQLRCPCDQKLFDGPLAGVKPFSECHCVFSFNTRYNTLRLVGISPVK